MSRQIQKCLMSKDSIPLFTKTKGEPYANNIIAGALTARSSAQKEAIAPPIECPVTIMLISPYNLLALRTAFVMAGRKSVLL